MPGNIKLLLVYSIFRMAAVEFKKKFILSNNKTRSKDFIKNDIKETPS